MSLIPKLPLFRRLAAVSSGARPPVAVEISASGVLAAAVRVPGQPYVYAWRALPAGAVAPGATETNLVDAPAVTAALAAALEELAPRTKLLSLIVPDSAVRVFVLDFDTLPSRPAEALPIIRFRLRKMVPFDVEQASVSYQRLAQNEKECRVLAAILPAATLAEYEGVVRGAGFAPGVVLPSMLASLAGVQSMEAVLAVNRSGQTLTTAIASGDNLLLYRTLDLPEEEPLQLEEARRCVAVALAYYEDLLRFRPTQLLYAGPGGAQSFAAWLGASDFTVADLVARPATGALTALGEASIAAVAGALAEA